MLLDCGDTFALKGQKNQKFPELRAETIFAGMGSMGYDVINVADGELSLGMDFFKGLSAGADFSFVSANIEEVSDVQPYVVKQVGNLRLGITGITADVFFPDDKSENKGPLITGHVEALKKILPELTEKSDIVILLSHLGYQGTLNLLRYDGLSGIDVAIAGHGRKILKEEQMVNGTIVVQNSMGGEFLGLLRLERGKDGVIKASRAQLIALTDDMPEDEGVLGLMEEFKQQERKKRKSLRREREKAKLQEIQTKILHMSPGQFVDMMQKENARAVDSAQPATVPLQGE